MTEFGHVPHPVPRRLWEQAMAVLAPAIERGGNDPADVESDIVTGHAQLWIAREAWDVASAAVTRMIDGDNLEIWLMAGRWADTRFLPDMERAAGNGGAASISMGGRKGWTRLLRRHGWHGADGIMRKVL